MFNPCFCINLRKGCFWVGLLFTTTVSLNIFLSAINITAHYSRGCQINLGFQIIYLLPVLPYIVGVFTRTRELIVPFIVTVAISGILSLLWMILFAIVKDFEKKIFTLGGNKYIFFVSWIVSGVLYAYFVVVMICYWLKLTDGLRKNSQEIETVTNSYAIRRFGNFFVSESERHKKNSFAWNSMFVMQ